MVLSNLILVVLCFVLGLVLKRTGRFPAGSAQVLNAFIINISLPAAALLYLHEMKLEKALIYPSLMAWVAFLIGAVLTYTFAKFMKFDDRSTGCLIIVGGLGNTSFVGLPMISAFYGEQFIGIGMICDQVGSFLVLSTLGIIIAARYSSGKVSAKNILNKVLLFPPFQGIIIALLLRPVDYPVWLIELFTKLTSTITPLALVSVGLQMNMKEIKGMYAKLSWGLFYKLILAPAFVYVIFIFFMGARGEIIQVTVFEAAMGPMITAGIVAIDNDLNPPLAAMMLGIGIPLSFLTLPVWHYLLRWV